MNWMTWLQAAWPALARGQRVEVPRFLPHPGRSGFERPPLAEPAGQVADWVVSVTDGSRVHLHEFADGTLVAHRDETDPKRGVAEAMWHWATESTTGQLFVGGAVILGVVKLLERR